MHIQNEKKLIKYCFLRKDDSGNSDDRKRTSLSRYDDFELHPFDDRNYNENRHPRKRRPSTPPSVMKKKLQLQYYDDRRLDNKRVSRVIQERRSNFYLDLPYYDLSFLLNSDFLNVEAEQIILDVVYRYCMMVILDSAIINRLIRSVRFNYLDFGELLRISSEGKKVFQFSSEFQASLVMEMDRRMKGSYNSLKIEYERPRFNYKTKDPKDLSCNISEVISKWIVEEGNNSRLERTIKLLKLKMEEQYKHHQKVKRRLEDNLNDLLKDKDRFVKRPIADQYKPNNRILELRNDHIIDNNRPKVADIIGNRRPLNIQKPSEPINSNKIEYKFESRRSEEVKGKEKLEELNKMDERQKEILKIDRNINNFKQVDLNSLKRREDMNKRKEATIKQDNNRYANIGIRTPHENRINERPQVIVRRRGDRNGFWTKITNSVNCNIF